MRAAVGPALTRGWPLAGIALAVVVAGFAGSPFWIYNLTVVALSAIAVVGLVVLLGHTGQVSFAQTAFMAVGGYGVAVLTTEHGWSPWLALAASLALAVVMGVLVGIPSLRLKGHYFAVGTFALALAVFSWAGAAKEVTGGAIGIPGVPAFSVGSLAGPQWSYWLSWVLLAVVMAVAYLLVGSRTGTAWNAIRANDSVAASLGIDLARLKLAAFIFSAVAAALSGALYVGFSSFASPDLYGLTPMLNVYLILFLGGYRNIWGPVLGAAVVQFAPQLLTGLERYQEGVFVFCLLVLLLAFRDGLPAALASAARRVRNVPRVRRRQPA